MTDADGTLSELKTRAQQGDVAAQCRLGLRYELGDDTRRDLDQAIYWYRLAAAQGDLFSRTRLMEVQRKKSVNHAGTGMSTAMGDVFRDFYTNGASQPAGRPEALRSPSAGLPGGMADAAPTRIPEPEPFDLERELDALVGMEPVKEYLRGFVKQADAARRRHAAGHQVDESYSLNMVIAGSSGTGKTTVARIAARLFKHLGLLQQGQIVETGKAGLVSEYTSQTAKKTTEVFQTALGGMLVVDEAHTFLADGANQANAHDREALETLETLMEKNEQEAAVVLTGSRRGIDELLRRHAGLKARFATVLALSDYSTEQLLEILSRMVSSRGFLMAPAAKAVAKEAIRSRNRSGESSTSGNAHLCRMVLDDAIRRQSMRIVDDAVDGEALITLEPEDFSIDEPAGETGFDLEARLAPIIGMEGIKSFLRGLHAQLRIAAARKEAGLDTGRGQSLHMVFKGSPGTGKTMMARILAELLQSMGVLRTRNLVETDRGGLVAGYVGQTAEKTREKIREAMDGILFIDEAYSLINDVGSSQGFGQEAIDTLVKDMDDNRDRIVVVLAGYTLEMEAFLMSNPGLRSRFPTVLEFPDYSVEELMAITSTFYDAKGYLLTDGARKALQENLASASREEHFGNGRYARNLYEQSLRNQALRLVQDKDLTRDELRTVTEKDIPMYGTTGAES